MSDLKPFFCYMGGKYRLAPYYPPPKYPLLIEPFAGAAGYATRHHARRVVLYDLDPVISSVWDYLIKVRGEEVLRLPLKFDHVDQIQVPQEAKYLIGFWLSKGTTRPATKPSPRMIATDTPMRAWQHRPKSHWGIEIRERIASQVEQIKHWKIYNKPYWQARGNHATWFVDPPYQKAGSAYRHGSKDLDYGELATWVRTRAGEVIACENAGATWLPFRDFRASKSTHHGGSTTNAEVIYLQG